MSHSHLDVTLLAKVKIKGDGFISACPACRENGKDTAEDNLRVYAGGAFNCIAHPKDREHNRRIFALVGVLRSHSPLNERRLDVLPRARAWQKQRDCAELRRTAKTYRSKIISRWGWSEADVWDDSPQRIDCETVRFGPQRFLTSLYPDDAIVWTGDVTESGRSIHAVRWKSAADWHQAQRVGPMTTPAIWKAGSISRSAENVQSAPYVVVDFDGFDGKKPQTAVEIAAHIRNSLAIIRWFREGLHWDLAAILFTGSVSLHAWFRSPPPAILKTLESTASALGVDAGLLGHPEHPCRLPGQRHAKTGSQSMVLWLQNPLSNISRPT